MTTPPISPTPAAPPALPAHRRALALSALGITRAQLTAQPYITPQLRDIVRTLRLRGTHVTDIHAFTIALLRYAAFDSEDAKMIVDAYDGLPRWQRRLIPIEGYACATHVSPMRILELITGIAVRLGAQASAIIAATSHPSVMSKTVASALSDGPDSHKDRVILHRITGALPMPKGSQTIVQVNQQATATAQAHAQQATIATAPPPEHTIRQFIDRFNEARGTRSALPPPTETEQVPRVMPRSRAPEPVPVTQYPKAVVIEHAAAMDLDADPDFPEDNE